MAQSLTLADGWNRKKGHVVSLRSPISISLYTNLSVTFCVAAIAIFVAFLAVDRAVERAAREDISREIAIMLDRTSERNTIPDTAILTTNIGRRMFTENAEEGGWVYLLAGSEGGAIVGNAKRMPQSETDIWTEVTGQDLGITAGPILVRIVSVEGDHHLLVGRRLTARQSLIAWFLPILAISVLVLSGLSSLLLWRLNQRFRRKVQAFNQVFQSVESGELGARIPTTTLATPDDDLGVLGHHVNKALDEVERLLRGLESYSQVAAHELNHSITNLRDRLFNKGEIEGAKQADQLIELVTHILELVKIEATPGFAMQTIRLADVVTSALDLYSESFDEMAVSIGVNIEDADAHILGSKPLIESALINLLSNALKHAPRGSKVTVSMVRDGKRVGFVVRDHGPGVSNTELEALAALGRAGDSGGHGFGLRHVEAVAIRHGAQLKLENAAPGLKASLFFRLS